VVVGTVAGFYIQSLQDVVIWLVAALYGGYAAANLLKWYWWRFNSYGYFWGMVGGLVAAAVVPALSPGLTLIYAFPAILLLSTAASLAGALLTPPDDEQVLATFYLKVRPWGFWGPVREKLRETHPGLAANRDFGRDMFNVAVGIVWQTALTALGIYLVLEDFRAVAVSVAVILVTTTILKFNWYDRMEDYPVDASSPLAPKDLLEPIAS
jgi:hypothetical protein